jgi:DHA1 family inner membrane transport protein
MAGDLSVSMPLIANLVSLTAVSWGAASAGRRLVVRRHGAPPGAGALLVRPGPLSCGASAVRSFFWVGTWATVAGACCGAFTGVAFAEVAGRVADSQRGRALGWVMSGQSLTLLIGRADGGGRGLADRWAAG